PATLAPRAGGGTYPTGNRHGDLSLPRSAASPINKEDAMADVATVVERYIAMWNETDPECRRSIIAETWTDDATYLDPGMSGDGPDGIDAMVAGVEERFPGHRFELLAGPDAQHDRVRFRLPP